MAEVFLSHSSVDKPLIQRLAIDLLACGIPVWYDAWELDLGQPLTASIFAGIDRASVFIIALSTSSVKSQWVKKELRRALEREQSLGLKLIFPVRLDAAPVPRTLLDRIYGDFSGSYYQGLEELVSALKRTGITFDQEFEHRIVPLRFRGLFDIDKTLLSKGLSRIVGDVRRGATIVPPQVVIVNGERYDVIQEAVRKVMDGLKDDDSSFVAQSIRSAYSRARAIEDALVPDVIEALTQMSAVFKEECIVEAVGELTRIQRRRTIGYFRSIVPIGELGVNFEGNPLASNLSARQFFGFDASLFDIGSPGSYFKVWLPLDNAIVGELKRYGGFGMEPLRPALGEFLIARYIIPQMIASGAARYWDPDVMTIGLA